MKSQFVIVLALCAATALGQDVKQQTFGNNSPVINSAASIVVDKDGVTITKDIVVKSSPAEDALVQMANQMDATTKAYNDLLQQARTNLDTKNKPILDEMKAKSKKWQDKIDAETKDLKSKIDANQAEAQAQFQRETAALSAKAISPQTITALEEIIRKEQDLPATAHYDLQQKKWVDSAKK